MKIQNPKSKIQNFSSVLIVKPSSLGDIVHTLPAVHALKQARPELKIHWLVNREWAPLLAGNADLERVIIFPRSEFRGARGGLRFCKWLTRLEKSRPDLALDFQGLTRSALLARVTGSKRVHCLGDAELIPRLWANHVVPADRSSEHAVERYLRLVADLGVSIERPLQFPLPLGVRPAEFQLNAPFLLLHPFSRGRDKSLAEAEVKRLGQMLAPIPIVVAGRGETETELPANCRSLLNKTSLSELLWLIRHAHFTVSVDSGPMHIAGAITTRLLGIHTWTNPRIVGPYPPAASIWKNGRITKVRELPLAANEGWTPFRGEHIPALVDFLRAQFH